MVAEIHKTIEVPFGMVDFIEDIMINMVEAIIKNVLSKNYLAVPEFRGELGHQDEKQ